MPKARARTEPDHSPKKISAVLLDALAAQIGVTRVARVTGLDRGGVEVACAIRPGGHVLQVSNGKGLDAASAKAGAILEAAELWAAERPAPSQLIFATLEDETGTVNIIVWPSVAEAQRAALRGSMLLTVQGTWQSEKGVHSLVALKLRNHDKLLGRLHASSRDFR